VYKKNIKINYFFFLSLFLILLSFTFGHLKAIVEYRWLFILHSFFLCSFEVVILIFLIALFEKKFPKLTKALIALSFIFLLLRFIDYVMINLMDSSLFYALNMLFGGGIENIKTNLQAADINPVMIIGLFAALCLIPIIGYFIYLLCNRLSDKKPLIISYKTIFSSLLILTAFSFSCDLLSSNLIEPKMRDCYQKRLPYSLSFFANKKKEITCPEISFKVKEEKLIDETIISKNYNASKPKNVFIFVIESLRKDYINRNTTPALSNFRDENIHFKYSFSSANGTHPSWFSIFYGLYPTNWTSYKENWKEGAIALKVFKSMGYKINVFSSADLKYHNMEETIFGKEKKLANSFISYKERAAWLRDKNSFNDLKQTLDSKKEKNNLFIVFLDSTHSEYNWPDDFKIKFSPVKEGINYLKFAYSHADLSFLKNRYYNALNYLDSLFDDFFSYLKKRDLYDNSIIVITADHGEEFFEGGSLFHGTHLNKYQTNIPTFYHFPGKTLKDIENKDKITSVTDIFPSILHFLTEQREDPALFDGRSIFTDENRICISSAQNGGSNSKQFALYDKKYLTILNHLKEDKFEVVNSSKLEDSEFEPTDPN
jgi:glucan phosphoethanolaminetransferase (alkaline phosphatase superfamily)